MSEETFFGPYEDPFFRSPESYGPVREEMLDFEFFCALPFSDLRFGIWEEDEAYKAFEAFPVWRLHYVKQLSQLAYIGPTPETQYLLEFNHARDEHTFIVSKLMEIELRDNHAPEELVRKGVAVGMMHDIATPALGDATKKIDQENLNEEDHWDKVMDEKGWEYLDSIHMSRQEMDDAVHNKGTLGKVLDIVDRISYVMVDLSHIIHVKSVDSILQDVDHYGYREELATILQQDPKVGDIYKEISINWETGDVYFTNSQRLGRLLELRALLSKNLYMNPISQARDLMLVQALKPHYSTDESDTTKLTPNRLRKMRDYELINYLDEKETSGEGIYGTITKKDDIYHSLVRWYPQHRPRFKTKKKMERKKGILEANSSVVINASVESKGFNPATHYKVLTPEGEVVPFKDFDPITARRIQKIADSTKGFLLFWQDRDRRIDPDYYMRGPNDFPPKI